MRVPLSRARDTAEIIGTRLGLPVAVLPEITERNWGALEGHPPERNEYREAPPGGESLDQFLERLMAGFAKAAPPGTGLPLIVSHSGVFRALRELLLAGDQRFRVTHRAPLLLTPEADGARWRVDEIG